MKKVAIKQSNREKRERAVLFGLIDYHLKTGKPVGSNTLKEVGFSELSSATIRNYFASLEKQGFLVQKHTSGGRIPTTSAYRLYALEMLEHDIELDHETEFALKQIKELETQQISTLLQKSADLLSHLTQTAVFLSAPRFDQDFVVSIKMVFIDSHRLVAIITTHFGVIKTETLHTTEILDEKRVKNISNYFNSRLNSTKQPLLSEEDEHLSQELYNEVMVRYIVSYSNFSTSELYYTGFSTLLKYEEMQDVSLLADCLSLFENPKRMRKMLKETMSAEEIKMWIAERLNHQDIDSNSSVLSIPYNIHQKTAGAIALLGPVRLPYPKLLSILKVFAQVLSESLTNNLYKFKIQFRHPREEMLSIDQKKLAQIEDQSK